MASSAAVAQSPFANRYDMKSALVYGATGAVGQQLLLELLRESHFTRIHEVGRRKSSYPLKDGSSATAEQLQRLNSIAVSNDAFGSEQAIRSALPSDKDFSTVFITLGTTMAAAGKEFEKIDREYVLNAGQASRSPDLPQRVVYCSSMGASATSRFLYTRSKGLTEQGLASMGFSETIIFRPGYLRPKGGRDDARLMERVYGVVSGLILSKVSSSAEIGTEVLGKAMVRAGIAGIKTCLDAGIGHKMKIGVKGEEALVIGNADAIKLANLQL